MIGIANSASDLNPCNLPLRQLAGAVARGVREAGGIPAEFPTISLGEDLMKPSAMLYRNLLAIEIEEMIRSHPLDGIVLLANCDKTVPGAVMGAASADIPTVLVTGGARAPATFRGRRIGTGTDLWRLWDERRTGDAGRRRVAGARALPGRGHRLVQHDGHGLVHGHPVRGARADDARGEHDPGRRPARDGRRRRGRAARGGRGPRRRPAEPDHDGRRVRATRSGCCTPSADQPTR